MRRSSKCLRLMRAREAVDDARLVALLQRENFFFVGQREAEEEGTDADTITVDETAAGDGPAAHRRAVARAEILDHVFRFRLLEDACVPATDARVGRFGSRSPSDRPITLVAPRRNTDPASVPLTIVSVPRSHTGAGPAPAGDVVSAMASAISSCSTASGATGSVAPAMRRPAPPVACPSPEPGNSVACCLAARRRPSM